jgi:hypothetical protein
VRGLACDRLVKPALGCALEDAGDFGEQVAASDRELGQRGYRGGFLVCGQVTPLGVVVGGAPVREATRRRSALGPGRRWVTVTESNTGTVNGKLVSCA